MPNCEPQSPRWLSRIDPVPQRREDPRQALADDRRADVADVHRLGDVGRRIVDDDRLGRLGRARVPATRRRAGRPAVRDEPVVAEPDVEEAGAGDLGRVGQRGEVDRLRHLLAPARAGSAERLGQGHAAVGLVVAELGVGARADGRGEGGRVSPLGCGGGEGWRSRSRTFMSLGSGREAGGEAHTEQSDILRRERRASLSGSR